SPPRTPLFPYTTLFRSAHAEAVCLAGEPVQVLRGSGGSGEALPGPHAAGTGDGRHPGVRLARLSSASLGPQGNLFLPLVGRLGADRELTGTVPLSGHSQGALE